MGKAVALTRAVYEPATGKLRGRSPGSLEVCALLNKPSRRETDVVARWIGFDIPDKFVVGYGMDVAHAFRELPFVGVVEE